MLLGALSVLRITQPEISPSLSFLPATPPMCAESSSFCAAVLVAVAVYLKLTAHTGAWAVTWLIFPIYAALTGVIGGIFTLATGGKE